MKSTKDLINKKVNTKIILCVLWIAVMFLYVYADIKTLFQPDIPEKIMSGELAGFTINETFLLLAAILMSIPVIMIFLSLILKPNINRWLNIIVSSFHIVLIILTQFTPEKFWYYYIYYQSLEAIIHILIIIYAWKWPRQRS